MRCTLALVLLVGCERAEPLVDAPLFAPESPETVEEMRSSTTAQDPPPPAAAPIAPDLVGVPNTEKRWFLALSPSERHVVRQICRLRRADPCAGMLRKAGADEDPIDELFASVDRERIDGADMFCFHANGRRGCNTPLVVAFDAQPIELLPATARFAFEPGKPMTSAWPTSVTPWIALDRDGDGAITSGAELFGDATGDAKDGFEALAALDDNHDGVIDRRDAAFGKLLLWADDGDRRNTPNELRPLSDAVTSIPLAHDGVRGNVMLRDGRTGAVEDLYLPTAQ